MSAMQSSEQQRQAEAAHLVQVQGLALDVSDGHQSLTMLYQ